MKKQYLAILLIAIAIMGNIVAFAEEAPPSFNFETLDEALEEEGTTDAQNNGQNEDDDAPPGINGDIFTDEDANDATNDEEIDLLSHSVTPVGFNPYNGGEAEISYEIQGSAVVKVDIINSNGVKILTLVDEENQSGENSVTWNGTSTNTASGSIVTQGNYTYQISLFDPADDSLVSTAQGEINVNYAAENDGADNLSDLDAVDNDQNDAVMATQNDFSGNTAETGPGMLIYLLSPILGYAYVKFKKN